jgi:hypothetical protein
LKPEVMKQIINFILNFLAAYSTTLMLFKIWFMAASFFPE